MNQHLRDLDARILIFVIATALSCNDAAIGPGDEGDPPVPAPPSSVPAFPGAEGFGARSVGGRGGVVIPVTNLGDSGPGSFRDAVSGMGPRTIVFHVGGTITLQSPLQITNPFVTISGQTAPGGGIAFKSDGSSRRPLLEVLTNDVIIRHVRLRPGPDTSPSGSCCVDALSVMGTDAFNIIIDHVSMSWAVDEVAQIFDGAQSRSDSPST